MTHAAAASSRQAMPRALMKLVTLHVPGPIPSLNVSNAAAVALYALTRKELQGEATPFNAKESIKADPDPE